MSKRGKFILSLAISVFVVLSLLVSLVVVFAEENEIVRNVNAACNVYNADCHVAASYTFGGETKDFTISGLEDDGKFLTFDKTDATKNMFQEKMLKPTSDIVLTTENSSVVFEFKFANFDFNACDVTICLDGVKELENVEVKYSKNGINWADRNVKFSIEGTEGLGVKEASYFVRVSLKNDVQEFSFNQDFSLTIHS